MSTPENLSFAGEVLIEEVSIITTKGFIQTITNQVIGVQVFQDIFQPFLTGVVFIKESLGFGDLFPLIGEEVIRLQLSTPGLTTDFTFKGEFYIWKMADRVRVNERELGFGLYFMSKEAAIDINKRVSKAYAGKISDTITSIIQAADGLESKKPINIEETANSTKHISNFWTPSKNISYLTAQAINKNKSPSYVFFENQYGLNFVSLESLYQTPVYQTFKWDNYSNDFPSTGSSYRNPGDDYTKILELNTPETYNYMERVRSGMYASRMINYDVVTKKYTDKNYAASDNVATQTHLNKYSLVTPNAPARPDSMIIRDHKDYGNFNGYTDVTNTQTIQNRVSLIEQINAFKLEITVFGRMDYCVGQVVELRIFKNAQLNADDDPESYLDGIYSGKYIVSALSHNIDREKHECTMEVIKESFIRQIA
jgi:hypothetical protein